MKNELTHSLKTRHILMIALGSAIGTGLFFGTGQSIKLAGPSIIAAYALGGIIMYIVIRALGEMTVYEPNAGSFSYYASKYIGNYMGFLSGWNYWFNYIIVCMLELTASAVFLDYWFPNASHWITTLVVLIFFALINLKNVRLFGEFEFWFAGVKIFTIIAMIILGIYIIFFHHEARSNSVSNIRNLWQYGGFFAGGSSGFLFSLVVVVFSFGGTELVGITAAEAKNPHKTIPLAINGVIIRILVFYIAILAIIMCLYPWNKIDSNISPFVDVFSKIGIPSAASIMNIVAITAALSSLNSGIYCTARMMYSLSKQSNAPKSLSKLNNNNVPYKAILLSFTCILITVLLNYLYPKQIFNILLAIATIAAMINWITILVTQMYFRKSIKDANQLIYRLPLYPILPIIAILFFVIVIITMSQMPDMKFAIYIAPLWIGIISIFYYFTKLKV